MGDIIVACFFIDSQCIITLALDVFQVCYGVSRCMKMAVAFHQGCSETQWTVLLGYLTLVYLTVKLQPTNQQTNQPSYYRKKCWFTAK